MSTNTCLIKVNDINWHLQMPFDVTDFYPLHFYVNVTPCVGIINVRATLTIGIALFVCLLLNGTSAQFSPLVEIKHMRQVKSDVK